MSLSDQERADILRKSREILERDDRPVPPPALPEPPPIEFEDAQTVWNRDADRAAAARAAYKARARREEERALRVHARAVADASSIEDRLDALEARMSDVEEQLAILASASVGFGDAASERLLQLETLTTKLDGILETLRATHRREVGGLRDRLAATEAASARESAFLGRQLAEARRELDALSSHREAERLRADIETTNGNIVELHRAITERNGAA